MHERSLELQIAEFSLLFIYLYFNCCNFSRAILENPDILPSTPWRNIWWNDFWGTPLSHSGSHKSYRPLTVLSFKLNYMAGQLDPKGYHATNVILHSVTSGLVFVLAHSLSGSAFQGLLAGILFAVHPIHTGWFPALLPHITETLS